MPSVNHHSQYPRNKSYFNLNNEYVIYPILVNRLKDKQPTESQTQTAATTKAKQPSKMMSLILVLATITLYGFGINELSKIVIRIVEALVQETIQDFRF